MRDREAIGCDNSVLKSLVGLPFFQYFYWLFPATISFCFAIFFHFRVLENPVTFISDSGGYLLSATKLWEVLKELFSCHFGACWHLLSSKECSSLLLVDGPVLPLWGAFTFTLAGKVPTSQQWPVIVVAVASLNSLITAILAVLLKVGLRSPAMGLVGGLIWALYPGAIFASGLYLSEPLVTFVIVALTALGSFISIESENSHRSAFVILQGLISGIGFLLKPALVPLFVFLVFAPQLINKSTLSQKIKELFLGAIFLVFAPFLWAVYTKFAIGRAYFCPQRVPLLNIAVGHDLETDGWWCATPGSQNLPTIIEQGSSFAVLLFSWCHHPFEIVELYFRKVPRIVGFVWNDYKQPIFHLGLNEQNFLHALLLGLAAYGAIIFCFQFDVIRKTRAFLFFLLSAAICSIFCHVIMYLPFMANSRYGYPAMPAFAVLAVFGISCITRHSSCFRSLLALLICVSLQSLNLFEILTKWFGFSSCLFWVPLIRVMALLCAFYLSCRFASTLALGSTNKLRAVHWSVCAVAFASLIVFPSYFSSTRIDEARECAIDLQKGARLSKTVLLPQSLDVDSPAVRCFVIVDSSHGANSLSLKINGSRLTSGTFAPLASRDTSLSTNVYSSRMLSYATDLPVEDFRQWRIVEIPKSILKSETANTVELRAESRDVKLYADRLAAGESQLRMPSLDLYSYGKAYLAREEMEARLIEPAIYKLSSSIDWQVLPAVTASGNNDRINPRLFFLIAKTKKSEKPPLSSEIHLIDSLACSARNKSVPSLSVNLPVNPDLFDPAMHRPRGKADEIWINRYVLQQAKSTGLVIALPNWCADSAGLEVKLSGDVRAIGRSHAAGILLGATGPKVDSNSSVLAATAPYIYANKDWTSFTITDYANARSINSIFLSLFPGRPEQIMRYGLDHHSGDFLFKNLKLSVSQRPSIDLSSCEVELF